MLVASRARLSIRVRVRIGFRIGFRAITLASVLNPVGVPDRQIVHACV